MSSYAWIIINDHIGSGAKYSAGPRSISMAQLKQVRGLEGHQPFCAYDESTLIYEGQIMGCCSDADLLADLRQLSPRCMTIRYPD